MNLLELALRRADGDLRRHHTPWALVGGFAVSARAEPRFTRDVDIAVSVDSDSGAEALVRSLLSDGYTPLASIEQDQTNRLATVRLACPVGEGNDVVIDLLFASSGIEPEIVQAAEALEIVSGLTLPVARTGHLIALKLLARDDRTRPQDLADLHALASAATPSDIALAADSVQLITQRGYDRGRDLAGALSQLAEVTDT